MGADFCYNTRMNMTDNLSCEDLYAWEPSDDDLAALRESQQESPTS